MEFEKKEHAAIAASWPVASDSAKHNVSAAPMYPLYLEEVHQMVVGLVGQVEVSSAEMGSVEQFENEVSLVMGDFRRLCSALSKLANLDNIRDSLQRITMNLIKCVDSDAVGNTDMLHSSEVRITFLSLTDVFCN